LKEGRTVFLNIIKKINVQIFYYIREVAQATFL